MKTPDGRPPIPAEYLFTVKAQADAFEVFINGQSFYHAPQIPGRYFGLLLEGKKSEAMFQIK